MPKVRCEWVGDDPVYLEYHDTEWGVPVHEDKTLFEFLILESAQAGLSWITILMRREGYREAFAGFDVAKVAEFDEKDQERLLSNTGIIRNKLKIKAAINNAKVFISIQEEFGSFGNFLWSYVGDNPVIKKYNTGIKAPVTTELSDTISQDLKKRGMSFVGSTIIYAYLQAIGIVNDHTQSCFKTV